MSARATKRVGIYTRKSSSEGLEKEFTSLDAQREAVEAYVASMKHEGWVCLPARYDDGGFTGGNMDRPGLKRLIADVEAGRLDIVACYKLDRLSRSLTDFSRMAELFERRGVSFVSVTQRFDTTQSTGRLMLNMLLSFAQFERELVAERTRDKIASSRRQGKWWGARPPLGYGYDVATSRLVVIPAEAELVRTIFGTYISTESLLRTAQVLNDAGHRTKRWTFRDGREVGGRAWDKVRVRELIANETVRGRVSHGRESFPGEHEAIVDDGTWSRANDLLRRNLRLGAERASPLRLGLLNGLLRCASCDAAMTHACAVRKERAYRYYNCSGAAKRGRSSCPTPSIPAEPVEGFVVDRLRELVDHRLVLDAVHEAARGRNGGEAAEVAIGEATRLVREWEPVWTRLAAGEKRQLIRTLVQRIEWDGHSQKLSVTFTDLDATTNGSDH